MSNTELYFEEADTNYDSKAIEDSTKLVTEPKAAEEATIEKMVTKAKPESYSENVPEEDTSKLKTETTVEKITTKPKIEPISEKTIKTTPEPRTDIIPEKVNLKLKGEGKAIKVDGKATVNRKESSKRPFVPKQIEIMKRRKRIAKNKTARIRNKSKLEKGKRTGERRKKRRQRNGKSRRVKSMSRRKKLALKKQMLLKNKLEALKKKQAALKKNETMPETSHETNETVSKINVTKISKNEKVPTAEEKLDETTSDGNETDGSAKIEKNATSSEKDIIKEPAKVSPKPTTRSIETVTNKTKTENRTTASKPEHFETAHVKNGTSPMKAGYDLKRNGTVPKIKTPAKKSKTIPLETKTTPSIEIPSEKNETAPVVINLKEGKNKDTPGKVKTKQIGTVSPLIKPTSTPFASSKRKGKTGKVKIEIGIKNNKTAQKSEPFLEPAPCKKLSVFPRKLEALIKESVNKGSSMRCGTTGEGRHNGEKFVDFRMRVQASEKFNKQVKLPGRKKIGKK